MSTLTADRCFEAEFMPEVMRLIQICVVPLLAKVEPALPLEDLKKATDVVMFQDRTPIGVRVRRFSCKFRDITLRNSRPTNTETEVSKIQSGNGPRYYFYAWAEQGDTWIKDWCVVDMVKLYRYGIERGEIKANTDGTTFRAIPCRDIKDCMLTWQFQEELGAGLGDERFFR